MSSKKNEFDFVDFLQKHNRNAALDRSAKAAEEAARAKKEQARQAKLDREANDRHRAEMKEIARKEKEANDLHRAKMEEMARKEKEAKEFTKQQQFKLYDISCQIEELGKQENGIARIRLFYEINAVFEKIVHDAIEDLQYRKLYTQINNSLRKEQTLLSRDYKRELLIYQKYCKLKNDVESYAGVQNIQTFEELHFAEQLIAEIHNLSEEMPDLSLKISYVQELVEKFQERIPKFKWFWDNLNSNNIVPTSQRLTLLLSFYGVKEQIMSTEEWKRINPVSFSMEDLKSFCSYSLEYVRKNPSYTETVLGIMESIVAPEAEQTIKMIKEDKKKRKRTEKQTKEKEEDSQKKKEKDKENAATCLGCLGVTLLVAGIVCVAKDRIVWTIIFFAVGLFVIRGPWHYFVNKSKKNNHK